VHNNRLFWETFFRRVELKLKKGKKIDLAFTYASLSGVRKTNLRTKVEWDG